ncbi:uncharacterized protein [Henckelia pumila]|uniref:uncharacterized protein n=1 Tax=Henckelia pumila TaxID=405737 RepID=UPI003C6E5ABB
MAEDENNRALMELHRPLVGRYGSSILCPAIQENTFELKPSIIQMIQMQVGLEGRLLRIQMLIWSNYCQFVIPSNSMEYFPPTKVTQLRNEIMSFRQKDGESLNATWTRFKKMLRMCPVHGLSVGQQVETFYYGVDSSVTSMLDAAANGSLYRITPTAALEIISNMAKSNVGLQDNMREKKFGFLEMDALTAITTKLDGLTHQVSQLQVNKSAPLKQVNKVQGNTEAIGGSTSWGNHQNFGWKQAENSVEPQYLNPPQHPAQQRPAQQAVKPPQGAGPSMPSSIKQSENKSNMEDMLSKYIARNEMRWKNHDAMMQRVETQLGQLANQLSSRTLGTLPSDTEKNPKEVNVIFVQQVMTVKTEEQEVKVEHTPKQVIFSPLKKGNKGKEDDLNSNVSSLPFPQTARQLNLDHQFKKFLEIIKKLHVNIPFADVLAQMSGYAKFLKEILANKKKLTNLDTVTLNEECLAVLLKKLPPQLRDPGSFYVPCAISMMEPTTMSLKLADRSIKYPKGIVENVLLKVNEFIFPVDFVVLDMDDDRETSLILGRPFLAISRALIDIQQRELILRLNEKQVMFNMFNNYYYPMSNYSCLNFYTHSTCAGENVEVRNTVKSSSLKMNGLTTISQNPKLSIKEPPGLESQCLPSYLKYLTLEDSSIPIIVSSSLAGQEETKLARLLCNYIHTMGWIIDDIKGLGPIVIVDEQINMNLQDPN